MHQKNGSHDIKQTDSSIIIVKNVCVLTSTSMIVYLFVTRSSLEQNNRKLISLHNNGEGDKHAHVGNIFRLEACMDSLVKVPPYSKLNFQGKHFFTQNWCNITLSLYLKVIWGLCRCAVTYRCNRICARDKA